MIELIVAVVLLALLALALRVHHFGRTRPAHTRADAIVVLGARVLPPGVASKALRSRVECAATLFHAGAAPLVLFTGGTMSGLPTEARVAADLASTLSIPPEACLLEEASLSTFENAREARRLLAERRLTSILLVTDDFHLLRATSLFRAHSLTVQPVAVRRAMTPGDRAWALAREVVALLRRPWQIS